MATRSDYRSDLTDKMISMEDSGYGDFELTDAEKNTYLELATARLFPAVYKKVTETALTLTEYGTGDYAYIEPAYPDRVFLVEDGDELEPIFGWARNATKILKIDTGHYDSVNVSYYDAYTLPSDDTTDAGIPAMFTPLLVLGALVEALESRQDSGVRGDPGATQQLHEVPLIDRLTRRYDKLKEEMAMSLPSVLV